MLNPGTRWQAVPGDALVWREWGGEVVVFNQATGSTHLLNELAGEILRRLVATERGATLGALAAELADGPNSAADALWTGVIAEVLSDFSRLGLAHEEKP